MTSLKRNISKIDQFLNTDQDFLNTSEEMMVLLRQEQLECKKTYNRQLNYSKGIITPTKKKKKKFPKRRINFPKVRHNFPNLAWNCMTCTYTNTITTLHFKLN